MGKKKVKENVENDDRVYQFAKELKVPKLIADCFYDIGYGITGQQQIDYKGTMLKDNKEMKYIPKTKIPSIIESSVGKILNEIHEEYKWKNEMEFRSDNMNVKIIDYPTYDDGCIIQYDNCKPIKVNKKYLKELYENRDI